MRPQAPIAIVGTSMRLPGHIHSRRDLWSVLQRPHPITRPFPAKRLEMLHHTTLGHSLKPLPEQGSQTELWGGFLPASHPSPLMPRWYAAQEGFEGDPRHTLGLDLVWHALEDARLQPQMLQNRRVGVVVAATPTPSDELLQSRGIGRHTLLGQLPGGMAGQIARIFGFRGPAIEVGAGCAASLLAIHQACHMLHHGEADFALVVAVNIIDSLWPYVLLNHAGLLAWERSMLPFDRHSQGSLRSEGGGCILLARSQDARQKAMPQLAHIVGSSAGHGGMGPGVGMPSRQAMAQSMRASLALAKRSPQDVAAVIAHGAAHPAADLQEARALANVFAAQHKQPRSLPISTTKGHLGDLESAAGLVACLHGIQTLQKQSLTPIAGFKTPRYDADGALLWSSRNHSLPSKPNQDLIAVHGFGMPGTHACILLSPPKQPKVSSSANTVSPPKQAKPTSKQPVVFAVYGQDKRHLTQVLQGWQTLLASCPPSMSAAPWAHAVRYGRSPLPWVFACQARTIAELQQALSFQKNTPTSWQQPLGSGGWVLHLADPIQNEMFHLANMHPWFARNICRLRSLAGTETNKPRLLWSHGLWSFFYIALLGPPAKIYAPSHAAKHLAQAIIGQKPWEQTLMASQEELTHSPALSDVLSLDATIKTPSLQIVLGKAPHTSHAPPSIRGDLDKLPKPHLGWVHLQTMATLAGIPLEPHLLCEMDGASFLETRAALAKNRMPLLLTPLLSKPNVLKPLGHPSQPLKASMPAAGPCLDCAPNGSSQAASDANTHASAHASASHTHPNMEGLRKLLAYRLGFVPQSLEPHHSLGEIGLDSYLMLEFGLELERYFVNRLALQLTPQTPLGQIAAALPPSFNHTCAAVSQTASQITPQTIDPWLPISSRQELSAAYALLEACGAGEMEFVEPLNDPDHDRISWAIFLERWQAGALALAMLPDSHNLPKALAIFSNKSHAVLADKTARLLPPYIDVSLVVHPQHRSRVHLAPYLNTLEPFLESCKNLTGMQHGFMFASTSRSEIWSATANIIARAYATMPHQQAALQRQLEDRLNPDDNADIMASLAGDKRRLGRYRALLQQGQFGPVLGEQILAAARLTQKAAQKAAQKETQQEIQKKTQKITGDPDQLYAALRDIVGPAQRQGLLSLIAATTRTPLRFVGLDLRWLSPVFCWPANIPQAKTNTCA